MKIILARIANLILRVIDRLSSVVRTTATLNFCMSGHNFRVLSAGRVVNLQNEPKKIKIGDWSRINEEILVFAHGGSIKIGSWFYLGPRSSIWSSSSKGITIGDHVLVSYDVSIHDTNSHSLDHLERATQTKEMFVHGHSKYNSGIKASPISIGSHVWIGSSVKIFRGSVIGDNRIIGAGSIVKGIVEPDTIIPAGSIVYT